MPSAGFEPAIPAIERSQTYTLERTATGIGDVYSSLTNKGLMKLERSYFFMETRN
jgi:hypothetical protein